jgi:hypothetical protein
MGYVWEWVKNGGWAEEWWVAWWGRLHLGRRLRAMRSDGESDIIQAVMQLEREGQASVKLVDRSLALLAHIAWWHRTYESYRGYLCYSDQEGCTALVDTASWRYVEVGGLRGARDLVLFDDPLSARRFVDTILDNPRLC